MISVSVVIISEEYILLDGENIPTYELDTSKGSLNTARTIIEDYLGVSKNWHALYQAGFFDEDLSVIFVTSFPEKVRPRCNLASWTKITSGKFSPLTLKKLLYASKIPINSQEFSSY